MSKGSRTVVAASAALVALLAAGAALAQNTQVTPAAPAAGDPSRQAPGTRETRSGAFLETVPNDLMRVSKIVGIGVIGEDPVRIGKVEDLLLDRSGRAVAVVIGAGGFLGMGEKRVAIPFEAVLWNTADSARRAPTPDVVTAGTRPAEVDSQQAAESMPGAKVQNEALNAQNVGQSGKTDPATGPAGSAQREGPPATELVVGRSGAATHAQVHLTRGDLEMAPDFRYADEGRPNTAKRP